MKRYAVLLLLFIALIRPARANIGETEAEIEARYGKPLGDIRTQGFGLMRGFASPEYVIGVKLIDGTCEMEMFSKKDQSEMSASEIERLLNENGGGHWKAEPTGKPTWRRWRRDDQEGVALYDVVRHYFYISSAKFYDDQLNKLETVEPIRPSPGSGD